MSSSKPARKRQETAAASSTGSKRPRVEPGEEQEAWDFSQWAWQDTVKVPLPSSGSSGAPAARWLGVQSLVSITGKNGKVFLQNAMSKRGLTFEMGFVEGKPQKTHIVMALEAPEAVVSLFTDSSVAKQVLKNASFVRRLEEAGADPALLGARIQELLAELNIYTPKEYESLVSFCKMCGGTEEGTLPLRASRVQGELVMALVDVVMLAKKCTYGAAQRICHRLLLDYWKFDMEKLERSESQMHSQIFHAIRLQAGSSGGQSTICVGAACLAEVLILIPGCELSTQLRKDMVKSFFGVGGSQVTFESLLSNPRIQGHLRGCSENPLVEFLQEREQKELVRSFPGILQKRGDELQDLLPRPLKRPHLQGGRSAPTLDEERLDWKKDLRVTSQDLPGVKTQFKTFLYVEIQKKSLPATTLVENWTRAPPVRLRVLASSAVATYLSLFSRVFDASQGLEEQIPSEGSTHGPPEEGQPSPVAEDQWAHGPSTEGSGQGVVMVESEEDDDILKVSEVMRAAGVRDAVYLPFRSDLANQMLVLKCTQTQGAFADRRAEVVRGIPISVHKYKKSQDWPLAWQAVQETQHLYQKRVRECLEDLFQAAGHAPDLSAAELARRVAASLRTH